MFVLNDYVHHHNTKSRLLIHMNHNIHSSTGSIIFFASLSWNKLPSYIYKFWITAFFQEEFKMLPNVRYISRFICLFILIVFVCIYRIKCGCCILQYVCMTMWRYVYMYVYMCMCICMYVHACVCMYMYIQCMYSIYIALHCTLCRIIVYY